MTELRDAEQRRRVLTDLGATLLVEAAAGTGKTALLAGRIVMLLASGADPASIAAITFTELAASRLAERIHAYVDELLAGQTVPDCLALVLPEGKLNASQRETLAAAATRLDQLTVATIHAFCQTLISSYAVEAGIDPGARMLDAEQRDAAFGGIFDEWLRGRFTRPDAGDDPLAVLSRDDPQRVVKTLRSLAEFRLKFRDAVPPPADLNGRPDIAFTEALDGYRRWLALVGRSPWAAGDLLTQFEKLDAHFTGSFATEPDFAALWRLAHPPTLSCMRWNSSELKVPTLKGQWERTSRSDGERLNTEMMGHFDAIDRAYRTLLGKAAGALLVRLADELTEMLDAYASYKLRAALLDFDDLLIYARRLVRGHDDVRREIGRRYAHIFVDEFQDTDPVQCDILFRIAADDIAEKWENCALREGALFLVGDPKQSIYAFRGADIACYRRAANAIKGRWDKNVIQITENFRSRPGILTYVNACFEAPLSRPGKQPGYVHLTPTLGPPEHGLPAAVKVTIDAENKNKAANRDAEAEAVAEICARLIGNINIRKGKDLVPLAAGDIALLAPTGTELWRYERALEERGLPIASQAGKGLYRRQEVIDLLALARALADTRDTAALGALLRGPVVGLTDVELLDITMALPPRNGGGRTVLSLSTDPELVGHPTAKRALALLRDLRRRARRTTPAHVLAEAIERLGVRPILAARDPDRSGRALANIEALLERARGYDVRGLARFARDVGRDWTAEANQTEGHIDNDGDAIDVITVHSAKGLEWPVVIPINTCTRSGQSTEHLYAGNRIHWIIGDVAPPELVALRADKEEAQHLEAERLWYVAATRARDLLIVPDIMHATEDSWARVIDLQLGRLPAIDLGAFAPQPPAAIPETVNTQTEKRFVAEAAEIAVRSKPLTWRRPSEHDRDRLTDVDVVTIEFGDAPQGSVPAGAGRVRGLVLHKLIEEILCGETEENPAALEIRAGQLTTELVKEAGAVAPNAAEMAATVLRTLSLPQIAPLRPFLVAEWPVYAMLGADEALSGRIDALARVDGVTILVDWKSDIAPTADVIREHVAQLANYRRESGAARAALVYMTSGQVVWAGTPAG